jgi:D-lactate dehydrogenase
MRVAVFSSKKYTEFFLVAANARHGHELVFLEPRLCAETASLARGFPCVCLFVNDQADATVLELLHDGGTRLLALRCAGYNNVDLAAAGELGVTVIRVPDYSPHAVAEHAVGLILALNRKIHRAYARVREGNLELEGLLGFDLHGRTVGVIGTGRIGTVVARILSGFGCRVLGCDPAENDEFRSVGRYVELPELLAESDVVTLHCPLTPQTHHLIGADAVRRMKRGVMLINTSRGALIDTRTVIRGLKSGKIGYLGLDVYEEEEGLFFDDLSSKVIQDDVFARLQTFPNVIMTGHQAFFTRDALAAIAETALAGISDFEHGRDLAHEVTLDRVSR